LTDGATPVAAPQGLRVLPSGRSIFSRLPREPDIAPPRWTSGPSRPVDAPAPREITLVMAAATPVRNDMRPSLYMPASITSATPWGRPPGMT